MTAGRDVVEVHWMPRPGACDVLHRQPAAHGLLSFLSLLGAFLLNVRLRKISDCVFLVPDEVTGGVYKHITASAQRRLSIERAGAKDGSFLDTFGNGAIGRARSESRSTFVSKLMHEHLETEARHEM